jgi:hypothetical protein
MKKFVDRTNATGVSLRFFQSGGSWWATKPYRSPEFDSAQRGRSDLAALSMLFVFNSEGLITKVRVLYDEDCESKPATA